MSHFYISIDLYGDSYQPPKRNLAIFSNSACQQLVGGAEDKFNLFTVIHDFHSCKLFKMESRVIDHTHHNHAHFTTTPDRKQIASNNYIKNNFYGGFKLKQ